MKSTYGKQLRHGYAILEVSENSFKLDYEELSFDCTDPHESKTDLRQWGADVFGYWQENISKDATMGYWV